MDLSEKDRKKIERNELENKAYEDTLEKFLKNKLPTNELVRIGTTPFCLRVSGAGVMPLVIPTSDLRNAMAGQQLSNRNKRDHTENHNIPIETIRKFPEALRNPLCICIGSRPNSLLLISDLLDKKGQNIVFPVYLSVRGLRSNVNKIESIYGKKNIQDYISRLHNENKVIAVNKEKIDKCFVNQSNANIGLQLSKFENIINLDNSIAYSMTNVKYPNENNLNKGDELSMTEQQMLEQIEALRKEFEGKLAKMEEKFDDLSSKVETIDKFVAAITEAQGFEQTMNEVESVTKQLTGCNEAVFYCYDNAAEKFFSGSEDHRNWTDPQSAQDIKSAFDSGVISENGNRAVIPLISSKGETVGVIAAEKENGFTAADLDYFKQGSQIIGTVELALNKEFEHQGRVTDELTGLKNRQGLNEYVSDTVRRNINEDKPVNIVMCDIDHFKSINDTYGHDAGDIVLKNVAQILQDGTRAGSDCAFRMGGEEMVLILNCEPERAYEIAERLRAEVESAVHTVALDGKEQEINVTISMGIHQMKPDREMTAENARAVFDSEFKSADELVYAAKESGRNKVVADISETVVELGSYISDDIPTYDIDMSENDFEDFLESNEKTEQQSDSQAFGRESSDEYCIFTVNDGSKEQYFRDDSTADVNDLINRFIAGGCYDWSKNGFLNGCTEISKEEFASLDKVTVLSPAFSAKFDFVNDVISVWDDEKIARVDFETAQKSIVEEQSTVNFEFEPLNYGIFIMNAGENAYYLDKTATDVDTLLKRFADSGGLDGKYTDFLRDCTLISELEFAELNQTTEAPPAFSVEFDLVDRVLSFCDKDNFYNIDFDKVFESFKENGTVNLEFKPFSEKNDLEEKNMRITVNGKEIASIMTNHSMTIEEAMQIVGYDLNSQEDMERGYNLGIEGFYLDDMGYYSFDVEAAEMNYDRIKAEIELSYAKAFNGESFIVYAMDKNDTENSLIAVAETSIYGGSVEVLIDNTEGLSDRIYSDIAVPFENRTSEFMETTKIEFENISNAVEKDDLCFSKADDGTFAVINKNEMFDNAYVLIAAGSSDKPLEFYKDVSDEIKEYITSTVQEKEISADCSKFVSETESIKDWIDEAQDKLEERSNNIDEQSKNEIR